MHFLDPIPPETNCLHCDPLSLNTLATGHCDHAHVLFVCVYTVQVITQPKLCDFV